MCNEVSDPPHSVHLLLHDIHGRCLVLHESSSNKRGHAQIFSIHGDHTQEGERYQVESIVIIIAIKVMMRYCNVGVMIMHVHRIMLVVHGSPQGVCSSALGSSSIAVYLSTPSSFLAETSWQDRMVLHTSSCQFHL